LILDVNDEVFFTRSQHEDIVRLGCFIICRNGMTSAKEQVYQSYYAMNYFHGSLQYFVTTAKENNAVLKPTVSNLTAIITSDGTILEKKEAVRHILLWPDVSMSGNYSQKQTQTSPYRTHPIAAELIMEYAERLSYYDIVLHLLRVFSYQNMDMRVVTQLSDARRILLAKLFANSYNVDDICELFTIDQMLRTVSARFVTPVEV
jgi:hypothetical protein